MEFCTPNSPSGDAGYANRTLFSPKFSIQIGYWNIRSLGDPTKKNSKLRAVLNTMKEKAMEILILSEVRWPGHGSHS